MSRMLGANFRAFAVSAAVLATAVSAAADEPKSPEPPKVRENDLADWDVSSLATGEWVEYELAGPSAPAAAGNKRPARRLACISVADDMVWVEITFRNAGAAWDGMVLALGAHKPDGKIVRALWGKADGEGAALTVGPPFLGPAAAAGAPKPTVTATVTVTKEKAKAGSSNFDCEKIELETQLTSSCCDEKLRSTSWVSEKIPFHARSPENPSVSGIAAETTWNGKPSVHGGLVKRTVVQNNTLDIQQLLRWGTDAKESLKRPVEKK